MCDVYYCRHRAAIGQRLGSQTAPLLSEILVKGALRAAGGLAQSQRRWRREAACGRDISSRKPLNNHDPFLILVTAPVSCTIPIAPWGATALARAHSRRVVRQEAVREVAASLCWRRHGLFRGGHELTLMNAYWSARFLTPHLACARRGATSPSLTRAYAVSVHGA